MRILSLAPLAGPGLDALRGLGDLVLDPWNDHRPPKIHSADQLVARIAGFDALVVEADHVSAAVIDGGALKAIGTCRGTPSNVDVAAATAKGVPVINAPGRNAGAVADLTIGLIYGLVRHIVSADADVRAGRFVDGNTIPQQRYLARELSSLTVGLVGCGAVGREVAARLRALGARVLARDPFVADDAIRAAGAEPASSLGAMLEESDVISVHAALGPETRGMIGAAELARVKPGALYVNTARYGIADEKSLLAALRDGRLAGAAFDHFENEILPPDHPLASMPNVILTPHIGGATMETIRNHSDAIAAGFAAVLAGKRPPNLVNPEVLPAGP